MTLLFMVATSTWSWTLGRAIAFGVSSKICCWYPQVHSNMWYRLTPILFPMPTILVTTTPVLLALSQLPILFWSNTQTQSIAAISLLSWHAFFPIFVCHVHSEQLITTWCLCNTVVLIFAMYIQTQTIQILCNSLPLVLFLWILFIQIQMLFTHVVHETPSDARQPRIV